MAEKRKHKKMRSWQVCSRKQVCRAKGDKMNNKADRQQKYRKSIEPGELPKALPSHPYSFPFE